MSTPLEIYRGLREPLDPSELHALREAVRLHYDQLVEAQQRNELLAIDLAERLCTGIETLLLAAAALAPSARADVVGAARYFISSHDAIPDHRACTGLDDDVAVFNHVVRRLGRADLEIPE